MLRINQDEFVQKVRNIHLEPENILIKKRVRKHTHYSNLNREFNFIHKISAHQTTWKSPVLQNTFPDRVEQTMRK